MKKFLSVILVIAFAATTLVSCDGDVSIPEKTTADNAESTVQESQPSTEPTFQAETTVQAETTAEDTRIECTDGLAFTLINDGAAYSVTDYDGAEGDVVIPSSYEGLPLPRSERRRFIISAKLL